MTNPYQGEVTLQMNGKIYTMRLTLGALAELEDRFATQGLLALIERFEKGLFTSEELSLLVYVGLKGAGWNGAFEDVKTAQFEGGISGLVQTVSQLLSLAFLGKIERTHGA